MDDRADHTAGPWVIDQKEPGELWVSNLDLSYPVCMVTASGNVTERDKADARLIAAAPDLLAALVICQKALAMMISPQCAWAAAVEADTKSRAAISRATGEA